MTWCTACRAKPATTITPESYENSNWPVCTDCARKPASEVCLAIRKNLLGQPLRHVAQRKKAANAIMEALGCPSTHPHVKKILFGDFTAMEDAPAWWDGAHETALRYAPKRVADLYRAAELEVEQLARMLCGDKTC